MHEYDDIYNLIFYTDANTQYINILYYIVQLFKIRLSTFKYQFLEAIVFIGEV